MGRNWNWQYLALNVTTLAVFTLLAAITWATIESRRDSEIRLHLETAISEFGQRLGERVQHSVDALQAISTTMVVFEDVSYRQFRQLAETKLAASPGMAIIEWQPQVAAADRHAFEQAMRDQGIADFRLWEPDALGRPVAAAERDYHYPVAFMISPDPGANTLGLDLAWSMQRLASKLAARDSGRPQSSGFFPLVTRQHEDPNRLGFAITLPV